MVFCKWPSEDQLSPRDKAHLQRPEDLWIVVDVAKGCQGVLVLLELCKCIAQRLTLNFPMHSFEISHHPTLGVQQENKNPCLQDKNMNRFIR